ncbi:hypothetical protein DL96DRAFT_1596212 [Flagelloscypha sp. PMI_526]|nr:hypothetical protein DL96DRAFT_1596212 [Flagelloscypha sp. PMI_526]
MVKSSIEKTLGPVLIGVLFSTLLTGIALLQVYVYWGRYPKDTVFLKTVVGAVIICQLLAQVSLTVTTYSTFISHWGTSARNLFPNVFPVPLALSILFGAIPAHIVEAYFVFRLHKLVNKYWISIPLWTIVAACFGLVVAIVAAGLTKTLDFADSSSHIVGGVFICAASVDLLTAALLCWFLTTRAKKVGIRMETMTVLRKLAVYSLETGALTSVVAVIAAITVHTSNSTVYLAFFMNLSGLFTNSLLASLNSRKRIREDSLQSRDFKRMDSEA